MRMEGPAWDNFMNGMQASMREYREAVVKENAIWPIEAMMADPGLSHAERLLLSKARRAIRVTLAHVEALEMDWAYEVDKRSRSY